MATCAVSYPADGRQQDFLVPFAYTRPDFIHVFIDEEPVAPAAIRWPSANTLRLVPAPPAGATVKIQRLTDSDDLLVEYRDGSVLRDKDLNLNMYQLLHVVQEAHDLIDGIPSGPAGPQGPEGPSGPSGPAGPAGAAGPQGIQGPQGPQGERGQEGKQGPMGPQGVMGPVGPRGPQGVQGIQGVKGDTGERGPQGAPGPQGATGDKGPMGDSPWGSAFGYFRLAPDGALLLDYIGSEDANTFHINDSGHLEVDV